MTLDACARLVERGDPDRFLAVMAAPVPARSRLLPLYAFNLEVARAPWVGKEPLIAEMRLQWWRDVVENAASGAARAHEIAGPLHDLIRTAALPLPVLDRLVAARRWDCWSDPFESVAALESYLDDTAGGLMWLAARALGAPDTAEAAVRGLGRASGAAAYLGAVPQLYARGRHPLPQGLSAPDLARRGLDWLKEARAAHATVPAQARPALLAGWQTAPLLRRHAEGAPSVVLSEFTRRGRLLWQAATGRW